ncbi:MAG: hypothetical protein K8S21_02850 [Gemmatimonadetes bacterium]|nr:hypothetical protein [Gemmatimonadota bacterium]
MSTTTKGILALLRDLMEHQPKAVTAPRPEKGTRPGATKTPSPATRTYDHATEAGDTHWYSAIGSPLLAERLPVLRAEMELARFVSRT